MIRLSNGRELPYIMLGASAKIFRDFPVAHPPNLFSKNIASFSKHYLEKCIKISFASENTPLFINRTLLSLYTGSIFSRRSS